MGGHAIICVADQASKEPAFKSIANIRQHNAASTSRCS
jgi:hypothetical protein